MAITNKEKGVWSIDQVYNKLNQGSIWSYTTSGDNHTLWAWGSNTYGSMGVNQSHGVKYSSPVQIPGTTWKSIAGCQGGGNFLLATKTDNTIWSWGYSVYGSLGINVGDGVKRSSPTQIPVLVGNLHLEVHIMEWQLELMEHYGHGVKMRMEN